MVLLIPIFIYSALVLWMAHHWFHHKEFEASKCKANIQVSVLIPFKNEAEHLPKLLTCLFAQDYPSALVEYLFINDHSDDGGERLLDDFIVIESQGQGKKAALRTGLAVAKGELIVTLDADCIVGEAWLSTMLAFYEKDQSDLIIGSVNIKPTHTLWEKIQAVEFQSLATSAGGAALGGRPIMCNGANLAFRKSLVETPEDVWNTAYVSGDDMFLLQFAKAKRKKISFIKSPQALVSTAPVGWKAFWQQRARWTSKAGGYRDVEIIACGLIVLLVNGSLLVLPFLSVAYFLLAFALKVLVDFLLLSVSSSFFKTSDKLWLAFLIAPFYPLYVLFSVLRGGGK